VEAPSVSDRAGDLHKIYGAKVWFNVEKRGLGKVHLEIGEHTADVCSKIASRSASLMPWPPVPKSI